MDPEEETKQEKREKRRRKQKDKMAQHGKGIAKIYEDAVRRRVKEEQIDGKGDS
jgi:hypothetical protein